MCRTSRNPKEHVILCSLQKLLRWGQGQTSSEEIGRIRIIRKETHSHHSHLNLANAKACLSWPRSVEKWCKTARRFELWNCAERFDSWWGHGPEIKWKWPPHYNVLQIYNNSNKLWQAQLILKAKATRPSMRGVDTGTSLVKALSPVGTYEDNSQSVEYRRHAGWHPTSLTSGHPATYHILWASCACHHVIMSCASGSLCASPLGLILRKLANQT